MSPNMTVRNVTTEIVTKPSSTKRVVLRGLSERERTPLIKSDLAPDVISDHFLRLATLPKKARVLEVRFRSRNALYDDDEATCDAVNRYNLRITIPSLFPPPASIKMST